MGIFIKVSFKMDGRETSSVESKEGKMKDVCAVVLAAGKGTRMRSGLIKLAHPLSSEPLVKFAVNACVNSGVGRIIVVVGYQADKIKSILGEEFEYVYQEGRLGTGDAVRRAASLLGDFQGELIVLPGDAPFIRPSNLVDLVHRQRETKSAATVLTGLLPRPSHYGRIIRDGYDQIKRIVESRNAGPEELKIKEVNSGVYCFDTQKLLPLLPILMRDTKAGEYYLTDVIALLHEHGLRVEAMRVSDPTAILGVNTPQELKRAWKILEKKEKEEIRK